mgnify:CR=1 FL=1
MECIQGRRHHLCRLASRLHDVALCCSWAVPSTTLQVNCSGHTEPTLNARRSFDAVVLVSRGFTKAIETAEAARGGGAIPTTQEFTDGVRSSKFVGVSGEVRVSSIVSRFASCAVHCSASE